MGMLYTPVSIPLSARTFRILSWAGVCITVWRCMGETVHAIKLQIKKMTPPTSEPINIFFIRFVFFIPKSPGGLDSFSKNRKDLFGMQTSRRPVAFEYVERG